MFRHCSRPIGNGLAYCLGAVTVRVPSIPIWQWRLPPVVSKHAIAYVPALEAGSVNVIEPLPPGGNSNTFS